MYIYHRKLEREVVENKGGTRREDDGDRSNQNNHVHYVHYKILK